MIEGLVITILGGLIVAVVYDKYKEYSRKKAINENGEDIEQER